MEFVSSAVGAGKLRRTSRFVGACGRAMLVAIDMQSVTGAGPAPDVVRQVEAGEPNGILVTWQIARRYPQAFAHCGLLLRVDGAGTLFGSPARSDELSLMYRAEQAAVIGADAVVIMAYPGMNGGAASLERLATLVAECEMIGLPVVAESIPGGWDRDVPWDAEHIGRAARICVEMGADAIKTMAPPDAADLAGVVESCEVPLFILGGPKRESEDDAVAYAREVVQAGASGIVFGRNVWSAGDPELMVRRLYEAVHGHPRLR